MAAFEVVLHENVAETVHALDAARQGGDAADAHRHSARLMDLLDRAAAHAIDTSGWASPDLVTYARSFL